ncbi:single-stranded DNA-binding protein [Acholeplasma laidlawii]|jgi:single-strand DNA-binding protein|uniref:Single-stranded DNA-binding protein n=2 Tax=Acholeplasma laidlawii TaxID=2148 RepID=A9NEP0_ACHLI|nr:single-stranded DNA-binding protein [Acholeplasma laidlawii]ABX80820.1 single-strand DNA-binding protein [Acholeplasma laidlawii PG-8A]NWH10621.1 single-stranded DNA-binding protein [Acholeplasma laidlawii]NWH12006.1 single-stranded DNA-binding protein [Acholeplasma laidlawii]NWH12585.1 single-stranded DNA-binding protein [Acholeplasma laidlawii]NWH14781.1 single-stranded DNA-binding protein [Acholeplasma laidlawii]
MINRVVLVGRITKDVDHRVTTSGASVVSFTLAVNRNFTSASGEREADFINCVTWRASADFMKNYVKKGNLLAVDGRMQTRNYEDNDGRTVYITEVVADSVQLLESRSSNQSDNSGQYRNKYEANQSNDAQDELYESTKNLIADDDLPF